MYVLASLILATAMSPAAALDEEELALSEQAAQAGVVEEELIDEEELIFGEEETLADAEEDL